MEFTKRDVESTRRNTNPTSTEKFEMRCHGAPGCEVKPRVSALSPAPALALGEGRPMPSDSTPASPP